MQIFVRNPSQWEASPLDDDEVQRFRAAAATHHVTPVIAHSSYLINLASSVRTVRDRSKRALLEELQRCHRLGVAGLVLHPGAHLGAGEKAGLRRISSALDQVLRRLPADAPLVLLENTAGQGTVLGYRLEHLAAIFEASSQSRRLGLCIDTCHAFAAGYPIDSEEGWEEFFERLVSLCGLETLRCLHLNDSVAGLGSRRDRHANLGRGSIGRGLFSRLAADRRLAGLPLIVETPSPDGKGHARDLALLRRARSRGPR